MGEAPCDEGDALMPNLQHVASLRAPTGERARPPHFGSGASPRQAIDGESSNERASRLVDSSRPDLPFQETDMRIIGFVASLALVCTGVVLAGEEAVEAPAPIVTTLSQRTLPDYPGKEVLMLAVEYPPGAVEHAHRHDANAFVYVLQGSIVMGVAGANPVTLKPGDTFHEGPDDVHTIGRNASRRDPAKFVVVLLKDIGKPAVLPAD
jgi:quercetin dioxygenase-like cupin family protein